MDNSCKVKWSSEGIWFLKFYNFSLNLKLNPELMSVLPELCIKELEKIIQPLSVSPENQGKIHSIRGSIPHRSNSKFKLISLSGKIDKEPLMKSSNQISDDQVSFFYNLVTTFDSFNGLSILYNVDTEFNSELSDILIKFSINDIIRNPCTRIEKLEVSFAKYQFTSKIAKYANLPSADTFFSMMLNQKNYEIKLKTKSDIKENDLRLYSNFFKELDNMFLLNNYLNKEFIKYSNYLRS